LSAPWPRDPTATSLRDGRARRAPGWFDPSMMSRPEQAGPTVRERGRRRRRHGTGCCRRRRAVELLELLLLQVLPARHRTSRSSRTKAQRSTRREGRSTRSTSRGTLGRVVGSGAEADTRRMAQ
jgi:hypothetical protein